MSASVTNYQKFAAALVEPLRDLEAMWHQMRAMRDPRYAVGVHLDIIGKLAGRKREGISDDEIYRRLIFAQITVNRSSGDIDTLLKIAELVVFDDDVEYIIERDGNAALVLRIEDDALAWDIADILIGMLRKAVLGGVRIRLDFIPAVDAGSFARAFRFSSVSDAGAGFGGLGSVSDAATGGELAAGIL